MTTPPALAVKLISAVLDDKTSRLKALTGRQAKKEALSFVDTRTGLNLLQIATVCGNVSAGRPPATPLKSIFVGTTCAARHQSAEHC